MGDVSGELLTGLWDASEQQQKTKLTFYKVFKMKKKLLVIINTYKVDSRLPACLQEALGLTFILYNIKKYSEIKL